MANQPSELALRELLAVSIGTVSCYATLAPFTRDAQALCEVLAEIGHTNLAAQLAQTAQGVSDALDAIGRLAVPPSQPIEPGPALDQLTAHLRERQAAARYPQPGTAQARRHDGWHSPQTPPGGFSWQTAQGQDRLRAVDQVLAQQDQDGD